MFHLKPSNCCLHFGSKIASKNYQNEEEKSKEKRKKTTEEALVDDSVNYLLTT